MAATFGPHQRAAEDAICLMQSAAERLEIAEFRDVLDYRDGRRPCEPPVWFLLPRLAMRVLVILPDCVELDAIRQRCGGLVAQGHDLAVCCVLASQATLTAALDAQRRITALLRRALDKSAEAIPVFVVSQGDRDAVDDCARAWGATEVQA